MCTPEMMQVLQVLSGAASGDAAVRVPAHQQLQQLEDRPGFASLLLETYACDSADLQGRFLAIVMCKNVVDRHWQPRAKAPIADEEKLSMRERLLSLLAVATSPGNGLPNLTELCMVLRRLVRFDYPQRWEALTRFLVAELQQIQQRGFNENSIAFACILHHVLKEQSTKKLLAARREFHDIGSAIIEPFGLVWCMSLQRMKDETSRDAGVDGMWRLSRYLDGCFLMLLTQGFAHLHERPDGPQMVVFAKDKVALLLGLLHGQPQVVIKCPFFLKNLKSVLKWWANLLHAHPLAFAQAGVAEVLHFSVEMLRSPVVEEIGRNDRPIAEGLTRASLQMIANAFCAKSYRKGSETKPGIPVQPLVLELSGLCHNQFQEFLKRHDIAALCDTVCEVSLRIANEDIQDWLADPEDQLHGPSSHTELRLAGETVVRALGQAPLDQPLVEHVAKRMQEEASRSPAPGESQEVVLRRDIFLSLLILCRPILRPHLQFQNLLGYLTPIALLAPHLAATDVGVLLPVRLCSILKSWSADIPPDCVVSVLQVLHGFMQPQCCTAIRLAALGPLRSMLDHFSDHDAWATVQGPLIDGCVDLLSALHSPEVQWRCLHLVNLFLCDEAESGRYEATGRTLQRFLALWRSQNDQSELLICHALLDVLRALVLMSCRSKKPHLQLSQPLLECCLAVISDCFMLHSGASCSRGGEANAALQDDAASAAACLGDSGSASATLFDSSSLLFLGLLRTMDAAQAAPLADFFPKLLAHYSQQSAAALHSNALDIVFEYCVLHATVAVGAPGLQPHYASLIQICQKCLQSEPSERMKEQIFSLLQILFAHSVQAETLSQLQAVVEPVFRHSFTAYSAASPPSASAYAFYHSFLPVICAWQASHRQNFQQFTVAIASGASLQVAALLLTACRAVRSLPARIAMLVTALALVEGGCNDEAFWQEFLKCCDGLIDTAQKKDGNTTALEQAVKALKSSLTTKLPIAARSATELQFCMLPRELRTRLLREDQTLDEVVLTQWFFDHASQTLRQLSSTCSLNLQALLAMAPLQVQGAFQAVGLLKPS